LSDVLFLDLHEPEINAVYLLDVLGENRLIRVLYDVGFIVTHLESGHEMV
jgi:hypothetical protein